MVILPDGAVDLGDQFPQRSCGSSPTESVLGLGLVEAAGTVLLCMKTLKKSVSYMLTIVDFAFGYAVTAT
jgi:hypothetical protein